MALQNAADAPTPSSGATIAIALFASALGGEVLNSKSVLAPGPKCSPRDRSLLFTLDETKPDGFSVSNGLRRYNCRTLPQTCVPQTRRAQSVAGSVKPAPKVRRRERSASATIDRKNLSRLSAVSGAPSGTSSSHMPGMRLAILGYRPLELVPRPWVPPQCRKRLGRDSQSSIGSIAQYRRRTREAT